MVERNVFTGQGIKYDPENPFFYYLSPEKETERSLKYRPKSPKARQLEECGLGLHPFFNHTFYLIDWWKVIKEFCENRNPDQIIVNNYDEYSKYKSRMVTVVARGGNEFSVTDLHYKFCESLDTYMMCELLLQKIQEKESLDKYFLAREEFSFSNNPLNRFFYRKEDLKLEPFSDPQDIRYIQELTEEEVKHATETLKKLIIGMQLPEEKQHCSQSLDLDLSSMDVDKGKKEDEDFPDHPELFDKYKIHINTRFHFDHPFYLVNWSEVVDLIKEHDRSFLMIRRNNCRVYKDRRFIRRVRGFDKIFGYNVCMIHHNFFYRKDFFRLACILAEKINRMGLALPTVKRYSLFGTKKIRLGDADEYLSACSNNPGYRKEDPVMNHGTNLHTDLEELQQNKKSNIYQHPFFTIDWLKVVDGIRQKYEFYNRFSVKDNKKDEEDKKKNMNKHQKLAVEKRSAKIRRVVTLTDRKQELGVVDAETLFCSFLRCRETYFTAHLLLAIWKHADLGSYPTNENRCKIQQTWCSKLVKEGLPLIHGVVKDEQTGVFGPVPYQYTMSYVVYEDPDIPKDYYDDRSLSASRPSSEAYKNNPVFDDSPPVDLENLEKEYSDEEEGEIESRREDLEKTMLDINQIRGVGKAWRKYSYPGNYYYASLFYTTNWEGVVSTIQRNPKDFPNKLSCRSNDHDYSDNCTIKYYNGVLLRNSLTAEHIQCNPSDPYCRSFGLSLLNDLKEKGYARPTCRGSAIRSAKWLRELQAIRYLYRTRGLWNIEKSGMTVDDLLAEEEAGRDYTNKDKDYYISDFFAVDWEQACLKIEEFETLKPEVGTSFFMVHGIGDDGEKEVFLNKVLVYQGDQRASATDLFPSVNIKKIRDLYEDEDIQKLMKIIIMRLTDYGLERPIHEPSKKQYYQELKNRALPGNFSMLDFSLSTSKQGFIVCYDDEISFVNMRTTDSYY